MSDLRLRADFTDHQLWWLYYEGTLDADRLLRVIDIPAYGIPSIAEARAAYAELGNVCDSPPTEPEVADLANAPDEDPTETPAAEAAFDNLANAPDENPGWVPDENTFGRRPVGHRGPWSPLQH